jgi:hypothetical protein
MRIEQVFGWGKNDRRFCGELACMASHGLASARLRRQLAA